MIGLVTPGLKDGEAVIRVSGAARGKADPRFSLERNEDYTEPYLGVSGWEKGRTLLQPVAATVAGDDLVLTVDWAVCHALSKEPYVVSIPSAGVQFSVVWPDIVPPFGGDSLAIGNMGDDDISPGTGPIPPSEPGKMQPRGTPPRGAPPPPPELEPHVEPMVGPPVPPVESKRWHLLGLAGAVLIAVALILYFTKRVPASNPNQLLPPPPAYPAGNADSASVDVLLSRNDPAEMYQQAMRRLDDRPQESYILLRKAAEDDFVPAEAEFARRSNPLRPRTLPFTQDEASAVTYYQRARAGGADVTQELEALHQALLQRDAGGDLHAHLALCGGWNDTPGCR